MADVNARCFVRKGQALVPSDFMAEEMLTSIPEGKCVLVTVRRARSPQNHAHFFAILRIALDALPEDYRMMSCKTLLDSIKLSVGHVRRIRKLNGEIIEIPDSIDWNAMDESTFQRFKKRALYVLSEVIGCDVCELEPEEPKRRAA